MPEFVQLLSLITALPATAAGINMRAGIIWCQAGRGTKLTYTVLTH